MRWLAIAAACATGSVLLAAPVSAQPILKRVEEIVRQQLGTARPVEPGYLGLIGDDTPDSSGVRLLEVYPNQPAAQAGLAADDLITEIDGRKVRTMDEMLAALDGKAAGTQVPVTIVRNGTAQKLNVTLGRRPAAEQPSEDLPVPGEPTPQAQPLIAKGPKLGVRTVTVTADVQRQNALPDASGAQVVSVAIDSPAARAGVPLGAVITALNGQPIRTPEELAATVRALTSPEVKLSYVQSGAPFEAKLTVEIPGAAAPPLLETRARPPQPSPLAPAEVQPAPPPTPDPQLRINALERRVQQLEERLKALEAKASAE